ncbi:ribosome maturation factor RimM [Actinomyces sp.]|uniref:ribosome maturation factor RimM n=1 Tax=Actinomyces sp. TaxID=29317 RepID=UPI0026DB535B|nr:ribosome maturation factor RimM [Actinomyces sp.]MDO4899915.1 ribosome maturation factor RimM [Actinomyces sp.]
MLLTVAVIGPAHALKGEVRLDIRTDDPEGRLAPGSVLPVDSPTGPAAAGHLTVSSLRFDGARWFAAFVEAPDRTAAEALRGVELLAETDADEPEEDAWYPHELVGLRAIQLLPDGTASQLGEVIGLEPGVAQDRLLVRIPDGQEIAVPFVEELVPEVDPETGTVIIDPPGGLFPGVGEVEEDR